MLQAAPARGQIAAEGLLAGTARADITPPAGHAMGGYSTRKGPATGVHDRLYARVLVLRRGGETVAFVACDLRSFVAGRVRERVLEKTGIRHLLVSSSHTHSGPLTWENRGAWYAETEDKIAAAVAEAASRLQPALVAVGRGSIYLGHNRRRIGDDGRAAMFWRNQAREPTSPVDPSVAVLRVDSAATGKTIAVAVHYACHPSILGPDNLEISADYPGAMAAEVEKTLGDGALCLFWQGGAGDINPYMDKQPVNDGGFAEVERAGRALAAEALRVARRLTPREVRGDLRAVSEVAPLANRWEPQKTIGAGLAVVAIGDDIALVALPGEPFVNFQIALADKSEVPATLLLGYTSAAGDEWVGYLPTIEAAVSGGYGAGWNTTVEVGAGERLVDRGLILIYQLLGKLKDVPQ